jgi:glutathione S-transferase
MIKLYDLAARDENVRFSPFCWRTKFALKHKGLDFETVPWRFTEKDLIAKTGQGRVPVMIDGAQWLHDSWSIALYLDRIYPDRSALMRSEAERASAQFMNFWCDLSVHPALRPLVFFDVYNAAAEKDRKYFRESREKLLGVTLEELCRDQDGAQQAFLKVIAPAENTLANTQYFGGMSANYSDYILFGSLQWANAVSGTTFVAPGSAVAAWFERMLDLFEGYGRLAPTMESVA